MLTVFNYLDSYHPILLAFCPNHATIPSLNPILPEVPASSNPFRQPSARSCADACTQSMALRARHIHKLLHSVLIVETIGTQMRMGAPINAGDTRVDKLGRSVEQLGHGAVGTGRSGGLDYGFGAVGEVGGLHCVNVGLKDLQLL